MRSPNGLPDPPMGHTLWRARRLTIRNKSNTLRRATHTVYYQKDDIEYAVTAHVREKPARGYTCSTNFRAALTVIQTGEEEKKLGDVYGCTINTTMISGNGDNCKVWAEEFLARPAKGYKGNMNLHGSSADTMTDCQKCMQILFEPDGQPKESLDPEIKEMLKNKDNLHFIDWFRIFSQYRRSGLSDQGMLAYLGAVSKLVNDPPVVLSPAPLQSETDLIRKEKGAAGRYDEIVEKLLPFYERVDYKMAHRGSKSKTFSITVMVRATSRVQAANVQINSGVKTSDANDDSRAKSAEAQMDGLEKQKEGTNKPTTEETIVNDGRDVDMEEQESGPLADEDIIMNVNDPDDEYQSTAEDGDQMDIDEEQEDSDKILASQQPYDEEEIIVVDRDSEPDDSDDEDFRPDETEARASTRSSSRRVRVTQAELANLNEFLPNPSATSRVFDKSLSGRKYGGKWGGARYLEDP